MCAACVAQGITYVGGAVGTLRLMAVRAQSRRTAASASDVADAERRDVEADRRELEATVPEPR